MERATGKRWVETKALPNGKLFLCSLPLACVVCCLILDCCVHAQNRRRHSHSPALSRRMANAAKGSKHFSVVRWQYVHSNGRQTIDWSVLAQTPLHFGGGACECELPVAFAYICCKHINSCMIYVFVRWLNGWMDGWVVNVA